MPMNPRLLRPLARRQAPATAFSPSSITDLALWLDADSSSSLTMNGTGVSQWSDKSGNANHATQATAAAQPTVTSAAQNGRSGISFDGTQFMEFTQFLSGSAATALVVAKQDASPPTSEAFTGSVLGNFGSHDFASHCQWTDGNIYDGFGSDTRYAITPTVALDSTRIFCWYSAADDFRLYIDGALEHTESTNTVDFGPNPVIGRGKWPGATDTFYFQGLVFEVAIYSRALTTQEIDDVTEYLANRWGVTL